MSEETDSVTRNQVLETKGDESENNIEQTGLEADCSREDSAADHGNHEFNDANDDDVKEDDNIDDEYEDDNDDDEGIDVSNNARQKKGKQTKKKPSKEKEDKEEYMDILGNKTLMKKIVEPGDGENPKMGERVTIELQKSMPETKTNFPAEQITFTLGDCDVEQALDLSVALMKFGEKATIIAGYKYMYGDEGLPPKIPPFANFKLDVHLLSNHGLPDYSSLELHERIDEAKKKKERGNFFFRRKDFSQAVYVYTKASKIVDPDEGCVYPDASPERLQELLEFRGVILTNTSIAQLKIGAVDAAIKSATEATKLCPSYSKAYFRLGQAYEQKGLIDEAIKAHKTALKNDPENSKEADSRQVIHNELSRLTKLNKEAKQSQKDMYSKMFWGSKPPDVSRKSRQRDVPLWNYASAAKNPFAACFNQSLPKWLDPNIMMNNPMFQAGVAAGQESLASDADLETSLRQASEFVEKMSSGEITNPNELMEMAGRIRAAIPPELDAFMKSQFEMKMQNLSNEEVARAQEHLLNAFPCQLQNMFNESTKEPSDGMNDQLDQLNGKSLDEYSKSCTASEQDGTDPYPNHLVIDDNECSSLNQNDISQDGTRAKDEKDVSCIERADVVSRETTIEQIKSDDDKLRSSEHEPREETKLVKEFDLELNDPTRQDEVHGKSAQTGDESISDEIIFSTPEKMSDDMTTFTREETGSSKSQIIPSEPEDIHSHSSKQFEDGQEELIPVNGIKKGQHETTEKKPEVFTSSDLGERDNQSSKADKTGEENKLDSADKTTDTCRLADRMACMNFDSFLAEVNVPKRFDVLSLKRSVSSEKLYKEVAVYDVRKSKSAVDVLYFDSDKIRANFKMSAGISPRDTNEKKLMVENKTTREQNVGQSPSESTSAESIDLDLKNKANTEALHSIRTQLIDEERIWYDSYMGRCPELKCKPSYYVSKESLDLVLMNEENTFALDPIKDELNEEEIKWYDNFKNGLDAESQQPKEKVKPSFGLDPSLDEYSCMIRCHIVYQDVIKEIQKKLNICSETAEGLNLQEEINKSKVDLNTESKDYKYERKCVEKEKEQNNVRCTSLAMDTASTKEVVKSQAFKKSKWHKLVEQEEIEYSHHANKGSSEIATEIGRDGIDNKEVGNEEDEKAIGIQENTSESMMLNLTDDLDIDKESVNQMLAESSMAPLVEEGYEMRMKNTYLDAIEEIKKNQNSNEAHTHGHHSFYQENEIKSEYDVERATKWHEIANEIERISTQTNSIDTEENQLLEEKMKAHMMRMAYGKRIKNQYMEVLEELKRKYGSNNVKGGHCSVYQEIRNCLTTEDINMEEQDRVRKWREVVNEIQRMSAQIDDCNGEGNAECSKVLDERIKAQQMMTENKKRVRDQYKDVLTELRRKHFENERRAANEVGKDLIAAQSSHINDENCFRVYKLMETREEEALENHNLEMEFYQRKAKQCFSSWESDVDTGYAYECHIEDDPNVLGDIDDDNQERQDEGYSWLRNPMLLGTIGAGVAGAVSFGLYRFYNSH